MRQFLLFSVITAACFGLPKQSVPKPNAPHPGKQVYDDYCLSCHQADGRGVPGMNPPLVKTDWVLGDKTRLINVVLKGLDEPLEINGESYQNVMPAHDFLTDQQVADVLTYVRANFGNKAEPVTTEEVTKVRASKK